MPDRVRITDVSPRDGLQNESGVIPTSRKVHLVRMLAASGVDEIEVSSFVSARWVPQLGDAAGVFAGIAAEAGAGWPVLSALVPNEKGLDAALEVNSRWRRDPSGGLIGKVSVFTAASETFARKNINAGIAESIERFGPVVRRAHEAGLLVRGYVSCAIACPFEGPVGPARVADVALRLADIGVDEVDLGDTIGAGEPASVRRMLEAVGVPVERLTLHLHDTFGRAAGCVREALGFGVRSFDGAAGGLGGCPYAGTAEKPAPGNIATETLVGVVRESGLACGVDDEALARAGVFAASLRGGP
ncbi:MAG: hydroxymethylglutaryl-CoA lyase [Phycisphaerales bacterium]|nr:hydroxymethylglutaryl-CoA lyase [Phycisphaerales bacterium]